MKKLLNPNFLNLVLVAIIFATIISCSEVLISEQEIISIENNIVEIENVLIENNNIANATYNGTVYFHCDTGPYNFTLDSLLANGNFTGNLKDTAFHLQFGIQPNSSFGLVYDYHLNKIFSDNNIDFTISRTSNFNSQFTVQHNFYSAMVDSLDYVFETDTLQTGNHPFYNAYRLSNCNFILELYIFNKYVGGCLHDELVWYYYE